MSIELISILDLLGDVKDLEPFRNLIFDFGGVLIDLDTERTYRAFAKIGGISVEEASMLAASDFFTAYEEGRISDDQFRIQINEWLGKDIPSDHIDAAWNAMLGDVPLKRLALLKQLRKDYSLYLLSNTNNIHFDCFGPMIEKKEQRSLEDYFDRAYFSHLLQMRKPNRMIFEHVLEENNLNPAETLFLDDNPENLAGASSVGIKTVYVSHPDLIFSIF